MRTLLFRTLATVTRRLRPAGKRDPGPLRANGTVLYLQFETPLGCCVHGTPLVEALREVAPGVRVVAASWGTGAAVLAHDPAISHLLVTSEALLASLPSLWRAAGEIRRWLGTLDVAPDWVIFDASNRRLQSALLGSLLRLAPTAGFAEAAELYDLPLRYDAGRSLIDNNLRVAGALGGNALHREPAVFFTQRDLDAAETLLARQPGTQGLVGFVVQGSGGQRTGWHDQRFAAVIRALEAEGFQTVFFGTSVDAEGIDRVLFAAAAMGRSLAGKTRIPEAAAALALCDLLITVDTGTMHLGRAVRVPMVVLGPCWQEPLEWLPLGLANVRILRGPDCAEVPAVYLLDEIQAADVLAAAHDLLSTYPPSANARANRVRSRLSDVRVKAN